MKQYVHTVRDPVGIHVRPVAMIIKMAKDYPDTNIVFSCNGKEAKATSLTKLLRLGIRHGAKITIVAEGKNEDTAIIAISGFVHNHL